MGANNRRPQFSLVKLQSVYREYKWEERRKGIVKEIMEASDKQIIMDKHKQLVALSMMLEINTRKIEEVYKEYVIDPKKFFNKIEKDKKSKKGKNSGHFLCVVDSMEELKSLFDYYKKITSPEMAENGVVTPGLSFVQQNVMLPQQNNTVNNNVQIRDNKLCLDNPEIRGQFFNLIKNIADLRANGESEKEPLLLEDKDDR